MDELINGIQDEFSSQNVTPDMNIVVELNYMDI